MEVSAILFTSFIVLVGLQLCIPETPNGKYEANLIEKFWTQSPSLRIVYGLSNILGVVYVLGFLVYLVFTEHWWYIGIYIAGLLLAKVAAFVLRLLLIPLYKKVSSIHAEVVVQRVVGVFIVILGMFLTLVLLK